MKMSLIVSVALALSFLLRRRPAALRHWVLAVAVACAAAMPILSTAVPIWRLPFATPTPFSVYDDPFRDAGSAARTQPAGVGGTAPSPAPSGTAVPSPGRFDAGAVLQFIWLAGTVVGLGILLTGILRLSWVAARANQIKEGRWHEIAEDISRAYGMRRPVVLLQSSHRSLLVTWGLARPKIILPAAAGAWTEERARVVLSHELAHIRRGDWIVQLLAEVLRAFYWFNPLLWVACRQLRLESEHACDDEVMSRGVHGTEYATHLIELARSLNQPRNTWFPAPAMARPSSLERRVRAMLNNRLDRQSISGRARAAILLLLMTFTVAVAAAQTGFATFSGSIADESTRGIPGTTVSLTNEPRQAKYEVKTDADGRFEFVGLPAGEYGVEVKGIGFQPLKDSVSVSGKNVQRSYTLKLGTLQETINVVDDGRDSRPPVIKEIIPKQAAACVPSSSGGHIVPPKKIRDYAPVFPANLRGTGVTAIVVMEARVALDGYITDIRIVGDAHPDFAAAAVAAVREWKFTQTLLNCQPSDVFMMITVNFKGAQPSPAASAPR
jgi:beta-lactamase regulating signal transducer with metallopeptidase domain